MLNTRLGTAIILFIAAVGCTTLFSDNNQTNRPTFVPPTVRPGFATTTPPTAPAAAVGEVGAEPTPEVPEGQVRVAVSTADGRPLSPLLRGSNVAAWLGDETLANPVFLERSTAAGITVIRLPGGSWSNYYDWLACERDGLGIDQTAECFWPWAAKPSDFLGLIAEFDGEVIYTVNANGTAQEAAALVAFFNGQTDSRVRIGEDRLGRNWGTVGEWATLRAERGFTEPVGIRYWEIGNEFYGGTADSGTDCTAIGWEEVWTCDGREYVRGIDGQDGFLAFAEAIKVVDINAQIGAIGVAPQREWSNWGNEVLSEAGTEIDFYIIHQYGYFEPPRRIEDILAQPAELWPSIIDDYNLAVEQLLPGRDIPVAVTEFNLFAFQENDRDQLMTKAVNAFFLTDTLGQLGWLGVDLATQWNLANGTAENGTDYGLLDAETLTPLPSYYVYPLWADFGSEMIPVVLPEDESARLSAYAGRSEDGRVSLMVLNKTDKPIILNILVDGQPPRPDGEAHKLTAAALDAREVVFNGQVQPTTLPPPRPIEWNVPGVVVVESWSITRFFLNPR